MYVDKKQLAKLPPMTTSTFSSQRISLDQLATLSNKIVFFVYYNKIILLFPFLIPCDTMQYVEVHMQCMQILYVKVACTSGPFFEKKNYEEVPHIFFTDKFLSD